MAARSKVAPPVPARKQSAAALSSASTAAAGASLTGYQTAAPSQQQAITLRPLFPAADSGAPMVYVHPAAEGQAQTAFGGPPAAIQPLPPPMNIEPPDNLKGTSVYDITDKDVDNFRSEANPRQIDEGENYLLGSTCPRNFIKFLILVICCITSALCLWPFSCICLFCASKFNERTSERNLEKDYVSSWSCKICTIICIVLAVCSAIVFPIIIISVSVCKTHLRYYYCSSSYRY